MSIDCSKEDALVIQNHLKTGFKPWAPEGIESDLHKPFMTANGDLFGLVKYKEDPSVSDPALRAAFATPYIHFEYKVGGDKRSAKVFPAFNPQNNRQAGQAVFIECNRLLGKPDFDTLGPVIRDLLTPLMGD